MLTRSNTPVQPRLILIAVAGLLLASCGALSQQPPVTPAEKSALVTLENAFSSIADQVEPSVVGITSEQTVEGRPSTDGFDFSFPWPFEGPNPFERGQRGERPKQKQFAAGSGVIIRADGYILTNDHVVGDADKVTIKLKDGREFISTKVLRDEMSDLALVKVEATALPVAKLGDSDKVKVGQWAVAVGAPFGLSQTLTVGVISAISREFAVPEGNGEVRYYPEMLQTDAAINMGNSGGPLVNINGEVIGINTAIQSPTGGNVGIGFAVPISSGKWVVDQLLKTGKVVRGYLGVVPEDVSPALAEKLGVKQGALITTVPEDSPAGKAGMRVKDVVIKFNNKPVTGQLQLRRMAAMTAPGAKIPIVVVRDKKEMTFTVTVGERTSETGQSAESVKTKIGIKVEDLTKEKAEGLGIDPATKGVLVSSVDAGSPAARAGIRPKDVITEANDKKTPSVTAFDGAVSALKSGEMVILIVKRGDRTSMVSFNVD